MKSGVLLLISLFFGLFFVNSCNNSTTNRTKIERPGDPTMVIIGRQDAQMNDAIIMARQTLDKFKSALLSNNPDYSYFDLKVKFKYEGVNNDEHIWIRDIKFTNGNYYGFVGNVPEFVKYLKLDDSIKINDDNISDWMYMDKKKLRGGYTIRVLKDQMSVDERQWFDSVTK